MKIINWNCQELGNPQIVQDLYLMVNDNQPKLVFLMETIINVGRLESLKRKLPMNGCFVVDTMGRIGDLALFWKSENEVKVLNYF